MNAKTPFCKHPQGCLLDAIKQALKQIKYGVIISSILQLIKSLRSLSKGVAGIKSSLTPEYLSIIVFLTSSTLALRVVKCILRWIRNKDDGFNSFVAGMAAGYVGTLTLNKGYWYIMLMFIASRIIGAIYQSLVQKKILNPEHSQLHYYLLFTVANMVHCYGYFIQADILKPDIYNLYERMSALTPNEKRWHRASMMHCKRVLIEDKRQFYSDFLQKKIDNLTKMIKKTQ